MILFFAILFRRGFIPMKGVMEDFSNVIEKIVQIFNNREDYGKKKVVNADSNSCKAAGERIPLV